MAFEKHDYANFARTGSLLGIKVDKKAATVTHKGVTLPLAGSEARVEAMGDKRVTATRLALTGVFALAMKKDKRTVYLTVDGGEAGLLAVEIPPKWLDKANQFAHSLNMYSRNGVPA